MVDTPRTVSYLLGTSFPTNGVGAITAQNMRDFVVSVSTIVNDISALTYAATVAIDASLAHTFTLTLTGAATLGAPSNLTAGMKFDIFIRQDSTGGRTLAYNAAWKFPSGIAPVLSTAVSALDILSVIYDGTTLTANLVKGIA